MNSRERFLQTINRKEPDRPPIFATFTSQVAKKMSTFLNLPFEEPLDSMLSTRASHMDLLVNLGNDAVGIATCAPDNFPTKTLETGHNVRILIPGVLVQIFISLKQFAEFSQLLTLILFCLIL